MLKKISDIELNLFNFTEIKNIAYDLDINSNNKNKQDLIIEILNCFKIYENYRTTYIDKYIKIKQLGKKGKEGLTYLVKINNQIDNKEPNNIEYAMKTFNKNKSSTSLINEAKLQQLASKIGVAPKVYKVDTYSKYILMEKMDSHLIDYMKLNNGNLTKKQQIDIIDIYIKLDKIGVLQGDSNIINYMYKKDKLYLIDYGMAKKITPQLCKDTGTNTPNLTLMTLGMIIKLKELKCPDTSYKYLLKVIPNETKIKFNLI
jgi:predicted Ser/Thr protein kinase